MSIRFGIPACLLTFLPLTPAPAAAPPTARDGAEIRRLVGQLGAGDFKAREEAAAKLAAHGEAALPALESALASPDPEVRRRAKRILDPLARGIEERAIRALLAGVGREGLKAFVRQMVAETEYATDERWRAVTRLTKAATGRASELGGKRFEGPALTLKGMETVRADGSSSATRSKLLLDNAAAGFASMNGCVVLSRGPLPRVTIMEGCVVIVDGDVWCTDIGNCVLACSGNVRATGVHRSLIVAGGAVRVTNLDESVVEASGEVTFDWARRSVFVNRKGGLAGGPGCKTLKTEDGLLQLFPFGAVKR